MKGSKIYATVLERYGSKGEFRVYFKGKKNLNEDNIFNIKNDSFLVDFTKVAYFDKKGLPSFFFIKGNALTISITSAKNHGIEPSSSFFDHMFRRHLWRESITSALKENKQMTWKDALPYMLGSAGIALVIGLELAKYIV